MTKPMAKKIILQFHHQQEKLFFFQCKIIEMYDIGTMVMKTSIGDNPAQAAERLKMYFSDFYEINPNNFIVKLDPKPSKEN